MFAVGHMAIGYLLGKATAKPFKLSPNIPTLLVLSIIPDIDIITGISEFHRGPTHSIITALLIFTPLFIIYRKKAIPYFFALLSHSLLGDIIGGEQQLLWPLTQTTISLPPTIPQIEINSTANAAIELTIFTFALIAMYKAKDFQKLFKNNKTNLLLTIPIVTVLLPTFLAYPLSVPAVLIPPHLLYLILFTLSTLIAVYNILKRPTTQKLPS